MSVGAVALWEKRMFVEGEGYVCWGGGNALLGGCPVGERKCPVGRRKCLSGKSVSPVSALEGYLGGVVGESEAKRGCESPAPPHGVACGG